ncbi:inositol monophosphatase [Chitinimonas sp.]|uniref:inositol monophosphatase family protein n=1 Tax=Chitinimonas sp. TaxID=1934313 RepID=UPI0035ADACDA
MSQTVSDYLGQSPQAALHELSALLLEQGHCLLAQQPLGAAASLEELRQRFDTLSGGVGSALRSAIRTRWPGIAWSDEELDTRRQQQPEHDAYWVCDPIDGALHYLAGLPGWTIALCLVVAGEPVMAVVHEPASGRCYRAIAGQGAECDGRRLSVNGRQDLASSLLFAAHPNWPGKVRDDTADFLARFGRLLPKVFGLRMHGPTSLLLAQVAAGASDGYWECGQDLYDWLPGVLLVREAGGVVSALDGKPFAWGCSGIVASGPRLHPLLTEALRGSTP